MPNTQATLDSHNITEQAILILDQIAFQIFHLAKGKLPKQYWDWIADDITPFVERSLKHTMHSIGSRYDLADFEPINFLAHWVHQWVMPYVRERYGLELPAPTFPDTQTLPMQALAYPDVLL